ncbi:MAG: cadmium-translocating P-type ATPase [Oscillospiraceae bacterium]|nr:cadmium-translocating P-type ATPase [Oscillospiraceae bacterium]
MNRKQKTLLIRIVAAAVFFVPLYLISEQLIPVRMPPAALFTLFLLPYLLAGYDVLRKALLGIRNRRVFDENFLMTVATLGAIVLGEYAEGAAVMILYQVGELFQSYAVGKSRRNITALMDIRPDYANLEVDGALHRTDPDEIPVGSVIVVQPGEKVPLDGVVLEGHSSLNTSALTGESALRDIAPGDEILSGCVNMNGVLKVRTSKEFDESTASKVLDLVENAVARKAKSETFIAKFARYYTPFVCYAALALAIVPPLFLTLTGSGGAWGTWIFRACTFLVISCPCALVISIPLSFFAGIGGASHRGILVKGANYLETLADVRVIAFDKTGTMTKGSFNVTGVHYPSMDESALLEYAAHAECASSHPVSRSLQTAYGRTPDRNRVDNVREHAGEGVTANVDGVQVAVGNEKLMKRLGVPFRPCHHPGTILHMGIDGAYGGHIVVSDELKDHASEAVRQLRRAGVEKIVMLTGDTEAVAERVAAELGLTDYRAGLLPADKVACAEALLQSCKPRQKFAFVGDGINDAPVLARADIGIAMGALGSDAAIEAADVVLMDDDPLKIATAIRIARKCLRIVRENIVFSLTVKAACLLLVAVGLGNMWLAIAADVGVMVLAVLNAMRCLMVEKL